MSILAFLLNLPWTLSGILCAAISLPVRVRLSRKPFAVIAYVRSLWWKKVGVRGTAIGHVVLLKATADDKDLAHELVHVQQNIRMPFFGPFAYIYQSLRYGYRNNKYEQEAYAKSGSRYIE